MGRTGNRRAMPRFTDRRTRASIKRSHDTDPPPDARNARRAGGALLLRPSAGLAESGPLTKPIPSTGEALPVVGLGSWITFNVGNDPRRARCLRRGDARLLRRRRAHDRFVADVRLVAGRDRLRPCQARPAASAVLGRQGLDLVRRRAVRRRSSSRAGTGACRASICCRCTTCSPGRSICDTLFAMKAAGKLRYVGITTSEGRRHARSRRSCAAQPIDFVQVTYNVARPRGRGAHPAAGARARHRRDRQPAVPRGRAARARRAPSAARLGRARSAARAGRSSC